MIFYRTLYKPEFCQMLIDHMAQGFSFRSFGAVVECGRSTLYDWVNEYEDFKNAKKIGEEKALQYYENLLKRKQEGDKDIDTACILFPLKTRFYDVYGDKSKLQIETKRSVEDLVLEAKKATKKIAKEAIEEIEYKEKKDD